MTIASLSTLTASSPLDLGQSLHEITLADLSSKNPIALALSDPKCLVYPFNVSTIGLKDLRARLMFEAVGLLSLPSSEIELDYQVLVNDKDELKGIFMCIPKSVLQEYLKAAHKSGITPARVTSAILMKIDTFIQQQEKQTGRWCVIYFDSDNRLHVAIFCGGECELLREIRYEGFKEARDEVIQSLRSVTAKSADKNWGQFFTTGNIKGDLIEQLKEDIKKNGGDLTTMPDAPAQESLPAFLNLDFMRGHSISAQERQKIMLAMQGLLLIVMLTCIYLTANIAQLKAQTQKIANSYTKSDYEYAKRLTKGQK